MSAAVAPAPDAPARPATPASAAAAESATDSATGPAARQPADPGVTRGGRPNWRVVLPTIVVALNAVAFALVRPDVNDLWAARARTAAVKDGVGLTYWFGWFGGGTTPGSYSILTPQLSVIVGTEVLCAISAVAVCIVGTIAVRGTAHPLLGAWAVAFAAVANLWSGRVPFLFGAAFAIGALIALRRGRTVTACVLAVVSVFASPVSGAFILMGLSGTFITTRTKQWRPAIAWVGGFSGAALIAVGVVFGTPGPEPFSVSLLVQLMILLALLWFAAPPDHIRTTIVWSAAAAVVVFAVPNGMGSNFGRFVWFCLPVVVLATATRWRTLAVLLVVPAMIAGASGTVSDLRNATLPVSSVEYYTPLANRLDRIPSLRDHRVEVVNHGAHAGYDALLGHAMLARGWETQEDTALNSSLQQNPLDPITYKLWLDNNAVGYVALPTAPVGAYPEYNLVRSHTPTFLREVWRTKNWRLFRVVDPTPVVAAPAHVLDDSQATLTVSVPCACTLGVRVRYSKFLQALSTPAAGAREAGSGVARATIADDGTGWTTMTTPTPGVYRLSGSLSGVLR